MRILSRFFGASHNYHRGSTNSLKDNLENIDKFLNFLSIKYFYSKPILRVIRLLKIIIPQKYSKWRGSVSYHQQQKGSTVILKKYLEKKGNYLYLLFQNYFRSRSIFKVFGGFKKISIIGAKGNIREYCHAFSKSPTIITEVVQTFWRMI